MDDSKKHKLKKILSPEQYKVAVDKGTEAPFSGKYVTTKDKGLYKCMVCGNPLFSSESKFETKVSGLMGWPSFEQALPGVIKIEDDNTHGMQRKEILCAKCNSHIGHIFDTGTETKSGKHYCVNCVSLDLKKDKN
jgi:peptide-methionine (R)-S-oxide reductase